MKRRLYGMMSLMLAIVLVISACSGGSGGGGNSTGTANTNSPSNSNETTNDNPAPEPAKELEGTLEFWTFDETGAKRMADAFTALHPKVTINVTTPGWNELPENLQTTIAAGSGAPDVAYIEGSMFSRFVNSEGFEDLLQSPYNAGKYEDSFSAGNWDRWKSLDGQKLLGMPWDMPPMVTFYRPDLIEAAGFPSDPEELHQFMRTKENLLELGQALKSQGVFLFEWNNTPIDLLTASTGYFDRDFNYLRNNDKFAAHLDMVKEVKQLGLAMNQSAVWSDEGKALTSTGKIAMLFYGPWYAGALEGLGEDQIGKWQATGLPMELYAGNGGSTMVIPSQSKNKELAWAFVEWSLATLEGNEVYIENGGQPGFMPAWDSPKFQETRVKLFGDQPVATLFADLMKRVEQSWVATPLNDKAGEIWGEKLNEAVEKNMDSKAALQQIQEDILRAVGPEMDKLKAELGK